MTNTVHTNAENIYVPLEIFIILGEVLMALFSAQIFQKMTKSEFLIVIYADLFRWSFPKSLWILMEFLVIGKVKKI